MDATVNPLPFRLLEFVQMLQPRQDDLLAGLGDLAGEENFVEDGVDLVGDEANAS